MPRVLIVFDPDVQEYLLERASKDTTPADLDSNQALAEIPSALWSEYCRITKAHDTQQEKLHGIFLHASRVGQETGRVHRYG